MECVAIDGVAGAGKTTVAKLLAKKLGWYYLNSGSLYRAFAYQCLQLQVDIKNIESIESCVDKINITVDFDKKTGLQKIFIKTNQIDFNKLEAPDVEYATTIIAQIGKVREKLTNIQREIAYKHKVVMEGRDIGTVVMPEAKFKFFLTASVDERAKRVKNRLIESGVKNLTDAQIKKDIKARDERDMKRKISPLRKAGDAITVDSTNFSADEVAEIMFNIINKQDNN